MSAPTAPRRRFLVRTATDAASAPVAAPSAPAAASADEEPLVDRVWRQVRDGLDRDRLLPAEEKRLRDLAKRLDRPPESNGWATFVAGASSHHQYRQGAEPTQRRSRADPSHLQVGCGRRGAAAGSHGRSARHRGLRAEPSPATDSTGPLIAETNRRGRRRCCHRRRGHPVAAVQLPPTGC